ncbi:MAG: hypothetical protein ABI467_17535 [Kofleriaceae bacterium]
MRSLVVTTLLAFALLLSARPAAAQNPEVAFNGRIMTSTKRFPQTAKSPSAYTAAIRKQAGSNFYEDKTDHTWTVYFAAFLKKPLNDVEYVIKFYELGRGAPSLIATTEAFNDERGQKTIVSKIKLEKQQMGVNKELQMTIENKGTVYASTRFKILGEGEHFTGKVNFSDDDANGKDKDKEDK